MAEVTAYSDSDGDTGLPDPATMTYTVDPNGALTIGGDGEIGQISRNGDEVVLADATSSLDDGWMMGMIGIKQETSTGLSGDYAAGGFTFDAPQSNPGPLHDGNPVDGR